MIAIAIVLGVGAAVSCGFLIQAHLSLRALRKRFEPVLDVDREVRKVREDTEEAKRLLETLRADYAEKRKTFDSLIAQAAVYDETIELAELGFYQPHFDFDTPERFKDEIKRVRQQQKEMVRDKAAVTCDAEWTVEGSRSKGKTMTNRAIRLTARAFNNECDAAISSTRWNNVRRMEERIRKAFDAINKLNESQRVVISSAYLRLKIDELRLTFEHQENRQRQKEEQAEIKRRIREEERLQREVESAAKEEEKYQRLLDRAREAAAKAVGGELGELEAKVRELEGSLAKAHEVNERAKSMAEQTKSGHIYVVSNIGSFGQSVYKIGMTRRLEPLDRVRELGDASVPFLFDVHAMVYSEDAPKLERTLHDAFDDRRLNLVNRRKEFFETGLDEIKAEVLKLDPNAEFIETAEAREYRESLAIRSERAATARKTADAVLPASL
ncbi:MAG: DUF4041 domain-containing protein [Planctomycetota bacterium]